MKETLDLANYTHPVVLRKALELTSKEDSLRQKLEKLFYYVRDDIQFGFLPQLDYIQATEIIKRKKGQCNNKGVLLFSLCKTLDIPVRMHFSTISKEIQRGLFKGLAYTLLPNEISHCWVEVLVEGKWRNIDSYINDQAYYLAAKKELRNRNWDTGFSVACSAGDSSSDFNIDEEKFVQMDAVLEDQGTYEDPSQYFYSDNYKNKTTWLKHIIIMYIIFPIVNRRVSKMRQAHCTVSCCQ